MSFSPVIHPVLLTLITLAALSVVVVALVSAKSAGARTRWALRIVLVLACVCVLLRPGVPGGKVEVFAENADVFIVVDTSASIVAEDWGDGSPRLVGVREDVQTIVDKYPGARFSLITFDTATAVRLPLTTDSTAVIAGISVLTPEVTERSAGSSITQASSVLSQVLSAARESGPDRSRLVFYLGDGEQTSSDSIGSFESSKRHVGDGLVLGYGTEEGGPMKSTSADPSHPGDEYIQYQGEKALSVIDPANLQTIADQLGIGYELRAAGEPLELPEVPETATRNATGEVGAVVELYWIPAAIAALLLAFEVALMTAAVTRVGNLTGAPIHRTPKLKRRTAPRATKGGEPS